ncbi:Dual specificity phosphatase [Spironucleus salmonicida]|uniref:Dual specificity phosphatase n=1 Tax=Spironucleus salmonicida TaxID=348837 RepID=V6LXF1_9EUKA|nr:Dual specificity phosphatase [Spironucleus salmonicida]|eukprot:EST45499.1 Dual specificity phosphatase [Spironucleus salmonicida]
MQQRYDALEDRTFADVLPSTPVATHAWNAENASRNRQINVTPSLSTVVEPYMNANEIRLGGTFQIASQAPLPVEFFRFFALVRDREIASIVQLCEVEAGKCDAYLPAAAAVLSENGRNLTVETTEKTVKNDLTVTKLLVDGAPVTHYALASFPDLKTPENDFSFLQILRETANQRILVHCSAGVGRTGVFIVCRAKMSQKGAETDQIILDLRRQRSVFMVQTLEQYGYCCRFRGECEEEVEGLDAGGIDGI